DILVRTPGLRVAEVPFHFGERHAGASKASLHEGMRFLRLLWRLRIGDTVAHFARFGLVGLTGLAVNTLVLALLTGRLGVYYLAGNVISLVVLTIVRYGVADVWIWARDPLGREAAQTHDYDIHGLLSVRSAVALPELEGFRAKRPLAKTDIEVRLGNPSSN